LEREKASYDDYCYTLELNKLYKRLLTRYP
jgi:hypothetical protein